METWKICPSYPAYEASSLGRIRRIATGNIIKPIPAMNGYVVMNLWRGDHYKRMEMHRVVADAFLGRQEPGVVVNHLDGDKHNNVPKNLEYTTYTGNMLHSLSRRCAKGPLSPRARLTNEQAEEIRQRSWRGEECRHLASEYGVSKTTISQIKHGNIYRTPEWYASKMQS